MTIDYEEDWAWGGDDFYSSSRTREPAKIKSFAFEDIEDHVQIAENKYLFKLEGLTYLGWVVVYNGHSKIRFEEILISDITVSFDQIRRLRGEYVIPEI
jgi:hypothetical protein